MDDSGGEETRKEIAALMRRVADLEGLLFDILGPLRKYAEKVSKTADLLPFASVGATDEGLALKDLTAELVVRFQKVTGRKYVHAGAQDAQAVKRLLKLQPVLKGELLARWEECLRMKSFPGTTSIAQFVQRINHFGKRTGAVTEILPGDPYGDIR